MRKLIPAIILITVALALAASLQIGLAQDTGTTTQATTAPRPTVAAPDSTVQIFFVACADVGIMNLSGTMQPGFDVFYQVFSGSGGTGTALTSMRQVQVDGAFTFSERIAYNTGSTVAASSIASAKVVIARESNSSTTTFETTVDDLQDGCNNAQNPLGSSVDAGSGVIATPDASRPTILSPFGGTINSNLVITPEPSVVIGVRQSDTYRSIDPGLIFAECDAFLPQAKPGIVYDTDNVVIFWSWYAKTEEFMQQHVDNAQYSVTLNGAPFNNVELLPIQERGRNLWAFYIVRLGNLRPGGYGVQYKLTWNQQISDGYDNFGPGTSRFEQTGSCGFRVQRNPDPNAGQPSYNPLFFGGD